MASGDATGPVVRALQLLRVLVETPTPLTLSELAEQVDLPASTVHRMLQMLRDQGMADVDRDSRRWRPGLEFFRLGSLAATRYPVAEVARPLLTELAQAVNETCQLGLYRPREADMLFVEQVQCTHPLRFSIPMYVPQPLIWGTSGRVICAWLPEPVVDKLLADAAPAPATDAPPPDPTTYKRELDDIRARGWDLTCGEKIPDSVGYAVAVHDARGVIGSISVTLPRTRHKPADTDGLLGSLSAAGNELSRQLGHLPSP